MRLPPAREVGISTLYAASCIYVSKCYTLDPVFHIVKVSNLANPLILLQ